MRWRAVLALAAIIASAVLTVAALAPAHSHPQQHACKVCVVGHLPCVQALNAIPIELPATATWAVSPAPRAIPIEYARFCRDSRAPPV